MMTQFKDVHERLSAAWKESAAGSKIFAFEVDNNTSAAELMELLAVMSANVTLSRLEVIQRKELSFTMRGIATW